MRTLRTPTTVAKLHEAINKYRRQCKDIEICIEKLMVIDAANLEDRVKEIDNMTTERARLNKEVTECLLLAPKEATLVHIEAPLNTDKVKIRRDQRRPEHGWGSSSPRSTTTGNQLLCNTRVSLPN